MIEIWSVAANALWVLGAAILLATLSEASMLARQARCAVRQVLETGGYRAATSLGLILFCIGMAATETRTWARWLWILVTTGLLAELVLPALRKRIGPAPTDTEDAAR